MGKALGWVAAAVAGVMVMGLMVVLALTGGIGEEVDCAPDGEVREAAPASGPQTDGIDTAAKAALAAGWAGDEAVTAVAVAGAESTFQRDAANTSSTARGMWQIMMSYHEPKFGGDDWRDPYANARVAYQIWQESEWQPWVAHTSGAYRKFLEAAENAVRAAQGAPAIEPAAALDLEPTKPTGRIPGLRPIAQAAADHVRGEFGFQGTIGGYNVRNIAGTNTLSEHGKGLAIDVMLSVGNPAEKRMGDQIARYFAGPGAAKFRVGNIIWNRQITNAGRGWEWGPYTGVSPHTDHVHVDFADGAAPANAPAAAEPVDPACAPDADEAILTGGSIVYPVDKATDRGNYGGSGGMWSSTHTGTDFSIGCGTPVRASNGGTVVIDTSQGWSGPWLVKVSTGPSSLTTWYAHMQAVTVKAGQKVTAGQVIGRVGSEGNSTGCHLHFEVHPKNGSIYEDGVNPTPWLAKNVGKNLGGPQVVPVSATSGGDFTVASFNVLGQSHTSRSGKRAGWRSGVARTSAHLGYLNKYGVDVVGLQEFQKPQMREFNRLTGSSWATYAPGGDTENAIAWRTSSFRLVSADSVPIPYFNGRIRQKPVVVLRSTRTGKEVAVANFHNPANTRRFSNQQRYRTEATRREVALAKRLHNQGLPVIFTGDFNERESFFCRITRPGHLEAAAGGSTGTPCTPPAYGGIDWIFGTTGIGFTGWTVDRTPKDRRISDHPIVVARVG